ncbi:MAG: hypothetical protein QW292_14145 [Candidatus Parvarchaeota archaeon]
MKLASDINKSPTPISEVISNRRPNGIMISADNPQEVFDKRVRMESKEIRIYGYKSSSNYGKYHYDVKGLLDGIPSIRYEGGNFLIREKDLPLIKKFIEENRSRYRAWRVIPDEEESTILKLHSP